MSPLRRPESGDDSEILGKFVDLLRWKLKKRKGEGDVLYNVTFRRVRATTVAVAKQ